MTNRRAARGTFPFPHLSQDGILEHRGLLELKRRGITLEPNERDRLEYLTARRHVPMYDRPVPQERA